MGQLYEVGANSAQAMLSYGDPLSDLVPYVQG
jgi:hypothetical protein